MSKQKSTKSVMTDRSLWLDLPLNCYKATDITLVDDNVPERVTFPMLPKLQVFAVDVAKTKAFDDLKPKGGWSNERLVCIKTGYSSGMVLANVNGGNSLFGKKAFFGEHDVVMPLVTEIRYADIIKSAPVLADPAPASDATTKSQVDANS